jgi:hypothetical protein
VSGSMGVRERIDGCSCADRWVFVSGSMGVRVRIEADDPPWLLRLQADGPESSMNRFLDRLLPYFDGQLHTDAAPIDPFVDFFPRTPTVRAVPSPSPSLIPTGTGDTARSFHYARTTATAADELFDDVSLSTITPEPTYILPLTPLAHQRSSAK